MKSQKDRWEANVPTAEVSFVFEIKASKKYNLNVEYLFMNTETYLALEL